MNFDQRISNANIVHQTALTEMLSNEGSMNREASYGLSLFSHWRCFRYLYQITFVTSMDARARSKLKLLLKWIQGNSRNKYYRAAHKNRFDSDRELSATEMFLFMNTWINSLTLSQKCNYRAKRKTVWAMKLWIIILAFSLNELLMGLWMKAVRTVSLHVLFWYNLCNMHRFGINKSYC